MITTSFDSQKPVEGEIVVVFAGRGRGPSDRQLLAQGRDGRQEAHRGVRRQSAAHWSITSKSNWSRCRRRTAGVPAR